MDPTTAELRAAHDVLAPVYAERLATILDEMPVERALLGLFAELVHAAGPGTCVADLGCGTGRLAPFLAERGLSPCGVDLSLEMVRHARRDHGRYPFAVADVRALPFEDASLDGALGWYSLMYLAPAERGAAFTEIARVLRPGGHLAMAFKEGDDAVRRGGATLGVGFDVYWHSRPEVAGRLDAAGLDVVLWAGRPAEPDELQPQAYVVARRRPGAGGAGLTA